MEIKFKVIDANTYEEIGYERIGKNGWEYKQSAFSDWQYGVFLSPRYLRLWCTGLLDKNGKEIYERDIMLKLSVDYNSEEYQNWKDSGYEGEEPAPTIRHVDYVTLESFRYWLKNETFGYEGENLENPEEWEIIGNVYQHPELLNVF